MVTIERAAVATIKDSQLQRDATRVRMLLGEYVNDFTDRQLQEVVERTGDADLATTALTMKPRPAWVMIIRGGHR